MWLQKFDSVMFILIIRYFYTPFKPEEYMKRLDKRKKIYNVGTLLLNKITIDKIADSDLDDFLKLLFTDKNSELYINK